MTDPFPESEAALPPGEVLREELGWQAGAWGSSS